MQGDLREASEVYKQGLFSPFLLCCSYLILVKTVVDADPSNHDAKMKLAEIYEIMDEPRKALELVYQGTVVHTMPKLRT